MLHQTAKRYIDRLGLEKLPAVKELRKQYDDFPAKKRKVYAEYKEAREEIKELYNVKANVSRLLNIDGRSDIQLKNRARERKCTSEGFNCFMDYFSFSQRVLSASAMFLRFALSENRLKEQGFVSCPKPPALQNKRGDLLRG